MTTDLIEIKDRSEFHSPMVSIICNFYNHEKFVIQAFDSFLMQRTSFEVEVLIHEDSSSDKTAEIIRNYVAMYPDLIKSIYQTNNKGQKGINIWSEYQFPRAKGKYIALCDGDDYWIDPLKLQKQVDFLEANPSFAGAAHFTEERFENKVLRVLSANCGVILEAPKTFAKLSPIHTSSFIFRKDALQIPNWFHTVFSADMALFSIISKSGPIFCFQEVMSHYRVHETGITRGKKNPYLFHKQRQHLIKCLNEFHEYKYNEIAQELIRYHMRMKYHGQNHYFGYLLWKCKDFTKKRIQYIVKMAGINTLFPCLIFGNILSIVGVIAN